MWSDPIWTLEFNVTEESHYVYTYESDGTRFRATAAGDPDCDGRPEVWVLTGVTTPTGVTTQLTRP